ncbi:MAG TPA: hypothetical protein VFZ32_14765 [Micromonosporaceae bacterium]
MVTVNAGSPPIALWAVPRSRSTAFLRVMLERGDLEVVHEPFSYLSEQGHFDLAGLRATSMPDLLELLWKRSAPGRRVFFKDTSDYRYDALLRDGNLCRHLVNTFMIRDPEAAVASHYAVNPEVTVDEVGYEYLHTIFQAVRDRSGEVPLVIDGDDLVADPDGMVRAYCERVGLPFVGEALRWQPGQQAAWQRTGHWHREVDHSTGLTPARRQHRERPDNNPHLARLVEHHRPFYEAMRRHRLVSDGLARQAAADAGQVPR